MTCVFPQPNKLNWGLPANIRHYAPAPEVSERSCLLLQRVASPTPSSREHKEAFRCSTNLLSTGLVSPAAQN